MTVSGMSRCTDKRGFKALFGRYVFGFNPWTHCKDCLESRTAREITPKMEDGKYILGDHLFYLCAVGQKLSDKDHHDDWPRQTNVHLAVRPRKGSRAAVGSVYGVTFVIEDAQAIPITRRDVKLVSGSEPAPAEHLNCKMFQFGYQMFEAGPISFKEGRSEQKGEFGHLLRDEELPKLVLKNAQRMMIDPGLEREMQS